MYPPARDIYFGYVKFEGCACVPLGNGRPKSRADRNALDFDKICLIFWAMTMHQILTFYIYVNSLDLDYA